jgi:hypothetical protein
MLSIAELAHKRNPKAIAEIIRQELQVLGANYFDIEVIIIDSNLELQIHTNYSIDKEKILTLVHSKLHNLHIESVAKFRVYCWRKDAKTHEQRLLWTEQFMSESLELSLSHALELASHNLSDPESQLSEVKLRDTKSIESQLSKTSVLQRAINKLLSNNPKAKIYLQSTEQEESISNSENSLLNAVSPNQKEQAQLSYQSNSDSINEDWQLLLVGLSIVLLGLGIGAFTHAVTNKVSTEQNVPISANSIIDKSSKLNSQNAKNQSDERLPLVTQKSTPTASQKSRSLSPEEIRLTSPNVAVTTSPSGININPSSSVSREEEKTITLDRFNRVQKGMTLEQVEKIFEVSGKVIAENTINDSVGKVYSWKNPQGRNAIIEFKNGQVVAKAQAGL